MEGRAAVTHFLETKVGKVGVAGVRPPTRLAGSLPSDSRELVPPSRQSRVRLAGRPSKFTVGVWVEFCWSCDPKKYTMMQSHSSAGAEINEMGFVDRGRSVGAGAR